MDCWLCQPAGTPIPTRIGCRLGVTFIVDVETDVLRPVHVRVERRITLLTHIQAAFDTLTVVFSPADATRLARVALVHFYDFDSLNLRLVFKNRGESVERPPVQVEVALVAPVFRAAVLVLAYTFQGPDVDVTNTTVDTVLHDVFGETVKEVGTTFRPLVMESRCPVAT